MGNKVLSMLGLAAKAGKVISGEYMTEKCIQEGSARLILIATDASENTIKKFNDKAAFYQIPIICPETKEMLGHAIGKEVRASMAITDDGFAKRILELFTVNNQHGGM